MFRIVQRKLYQKMGQIGQEMTELCHFYRNFRNGPQNFQKSKNSKRAPGLLNTFFGWFGVCFTWPHGFWPHFYLFRVLLNLPKNIEISKNLKNMISKNNQNSVISCPILLIFWYVVPDSRSYKKYQRFKNLPVLPQLWARWRRIRPSQQLFFDL